MMHKALILFTAGMLFTSSASLFASPSMTPLDPSTVLKPYINAEQKAAAALLPLSQAAARDGGKAPPGYAAALAHFNQANQALDEAEKNLETYNQFIAQIQQKLNVAESTHAKQH